MTEAEKKALYDKLMSTGVGSAAASAASGYVPPAPEKPATPAAPTTPTTPAAVVAGRSRDIKPAEPTTGPAARAEASAITPPTPKPDAVSSAAPTAAPKEETPPGGSFGEHYQAQADAYDRDLRGFASYMRGLADKGELVDASGKPLPMYSADRIAKMTTKELEAFMEANPRYANMYFPKPSAETTAALEGTGRTGVGESGFVRVPSIGGTAKPAASTGAGAAASTGADEDPHSEATMVGAGGGAKAEEKKGFGAMLGELAKKYGGNILEVIQAGAYGQAGIDAPLAIDKRVAEEARLKAEERAKILAEEDKAWQEKLTKQEREWQEKMEAQRAANQEKYARFLASLKGTGAEAALPDDIFDPTVESLDTYLGRSPGRS